MKVCFVTSSRAEYGLLKQLLHGVAQSRKMRLQLIVTVAHLSFDFGNTSREVEKDGFRIDRAVEILLGSDTPVAICKSMGLGMIGFAEAFSQLKPDLIVLLGDRYEIFAAASAALVCGIRIAHLHGGEVSEGAFDEALRHSITKMSDLHFVASDEYRLRVIQLGEDPLTVYNVGGLGVDALKRLKLLSRNALEKALNFKLGNRNLIITFHPPTQEPGDLEQQIKALLGALGSLQQTGLIFTISNSDTGGRMVNGKIRAFATKHPNAAVYESLGQQLYFSAVSHCDAVVGNSSSGLTEVPSMKKPTINIGSRQGGRMKASSVIDCKPEKKAILSALRLAASTTFQSKLASVVNPYGSGGATEAILKVLEKQPSQSPSHLKKFRDLNYLH